MYNMEISIGSYKFRLEIIILTIGLFWIMFGHVMCSCCTMTMREGFNVLKKKAKETTDALDDDVTQAVNDIYKCPQGTSAKRIIPNSISDCEDDPTMTTTTITEGFVNANNKAYGPEFSSNNSAGYIMNPDTWATPTLSYSKGTTPSAGAQDILNRKNPPLAEGEMNIFANTPFKPECCPNTYSSSEGCACMDISQYQNLRHRGGNNVPYSEY